MIYRIFRGDGGNLRSLSILCQAWGGWFSIFSIQFFSTTSFYWKVVLQDGQSPYSGWQSFFLL